MVEGPGCTRNGLKVKPVLGKTVTHAEFSSKKPAEILLNHRLTEVFTVGKELFLLFLPPPSNQPQEEVAMRLHFGMNGSLRINAKDTSSKHSLFLQLETSTLSAHETNVTYPYPPLAARRKLASLSRSDACGPSFDPVQVLHSLRATPTRTISDAVLDQESFPGVGNVIKVEALHRARIDPRRRVGSLMDEELENVIVQCREYAMDWFRNRRHAKTDVYNKVTCGTCGGMVRMQKFGETGLPRVTFWCLSCQPPDAPKEWNHDVQEDDGVVLPVDVAPSPPPPPKKPHREEPLPAAFCPEHGPSLTLRRVQKSTANQYRIFYTCNKRNCSFFAWADRHLPRCKCKRVAMLRISKTEQTGGKWFIACSKGKPGCGYFQWADEKVLAPLKTRLRPLL